MAILFNGSSQYLKTSTSSLFNLTNITCCCWITTTTTSPSWQSAFSYNISGTSNTIYGVGLYQGKPATEVSQSSGTFTNLISSAAVTTNTWYHIAMSYNGSTLILYVNGVQNSTQSVSYTLPSTTNYLTIGGDNSNGTIANFLNGSAEDARIYNRVLSANEVSTINNSKGKDGIFYGLVSRWNMNELGVGSTVATAYDMSSNKLNATSVASPTYSAGVENPTRNYI